MNLVEPAKWPDDEDGPVPWQLVLAILVVLLVGLAVLPVGTRWLAADAADQRMAATATMGPSRQLKPVRTLAVQDGWDPIAAWDPNDRRLTVIRDHLAADVLLCIGDTCKLVSEWVQR